MGLDFAVIGSLNNTGHLEVIKNGISEANIPIDPMVDQSPEYDRPWSEIPKQEQIRSSDYAPKGSLQDVFEVLIGCPDLSSRRWIWEQYDHLVMNNTIARPGGDAAVVRVNDTNKAIAMSVDCTPRYCLADPKVGGTSSSRSMAKYNGDRSAATCNYQQHEFREPRKTRNYGPIRWLYKRYERGRIKTQVSGRIR